MTSTPTPGDGPTRVRPGVVLAVLLATLAAGCLGGASPEVVEQQCGNVVGVGGCEVTVENPRDGTMDVRVTVEAVTADGEVAAKGTDVVTVPGNARETVAVGASNAGGEVDHYEVTVAEA